MQTAYQYVGEGEITCAAHTTNMDIKVPMQIRHDDCSIVERKIIS